MIGLIGVSNWIRGRDGLAESRAELDKALAIARATEDVKNVVNYMRVQAPKSRSTFAAPLRVRSFQIESI